MRKDAPPLERDIQRSILDLLALLGVRAYRINVGMIPNDRGGFRRSTMKGMSDIHAIILGRAVWIEVKREGGKVTPDQQRFMDEVNGAGGLSFVATSTADVLATLAANGIPTKGAA